MMVTTETTYLALSWSVSRGRDTYGYNICRLDDTATGKRYRCNGGGYDMVGTVFAEWLEDVHQDKLRKISDRAHMRWSTVPTIVTARNEAPDNLYGMSLHLDTGRVSLDGACGLSSIERVAKEIGLSVRHSVRRGQTIGFIVESS